MNTTPEQLSKEAQAEELIKSFRDSEKQMVASSVDAFYQALVVDPLENPNKLPESVFVEVFLPYFRGDRDFKDTQNLLGDWYAIAGSHVGEVQIIDSEGKALYNVPPYVNNRGVNATHNVERHEMSLYDIDGTAEAMSRSIPVRGKNFRDRKMAEKIIDMTATGVAPTDYLGRWKEIFARYEKPAEPVKPTTLSGSSTAQKSRIAEDEMDF